MIRLRIFESDDGKFYFCNEDRSSSDSESVGFATKDAATLNAIENVNKSGNKIEYVIGNGVSRHIANKKGVRVKESLI